MQSAFLGKTKLLHVPFKGFVQLTCPPRKTLDCPSCIGSEVLEQALKLETNSSGGDTILSYHKPQKNINLSSTAPKLEQDCKLTISQRLELSKTCRRPAGCSLLCLCLPVRLCLCSPTPLSRVSVCRLCLCVSHLQS